MREYIHGQRAAVLIICLEGIKVSAAKPSAICRALSFATLFFFIAPSGLTVAVLVLCHFLHNPRPKMRKCALSGYQSCVGS